MNWQATVTLNQVPERNQAIGWARALLNMLFLTGMILVFCLISGILFGGFRVLRYRLGIGEPEDAMIRLRLD